MIEGKPDRVVLWLRRGEFLYSHINSNSIIIGSFSAYPFPQLYHISYVNALFLDGADISRFALFVFVSIPFISIFSLISNL
jgi:hypothetical protein